MSRTVKGLASKNRKGVRRKEKFVEGGVGLNEECQNRGRWSGGERGMLFLVSAPSPFGFPFYDAFRNPFKAGNDVLSQSASSNHALLITTSALVIKKNKLSVSANQHSVIWPCM